MLGIFVELFPLLVLKAFAWMLPAFLLAWIVVLLQKSGFLKPLGDLLLAARRMSPAGWLCVAPLVVGLVVYASTKNDGGGTNDAPTHMSAPRRMLRSLAEGWLIPSTPVTPDEIAAGYRAPASGVAGIVPAPGGAVTNARWRLRGAHDDALRLDPAGLRIPVLDGVVTGVTVLARGEGRPAVGTLSFPVSPVDGVSLLPESRRDGAASLFWHALSPSNSLLLTWENALVGRDPNCPTNLQAELYADGRFAWRTDDAARLYLPVLEFDWDGDGLENSVDPDPLVAGPDAHGTNAEWYRVVCTNVFTGAVGSGPEDSDVPRLLPEGVAFRPDAFTNAYYFVDVVAEQGPAPIYFTGDQAGFIGAPVVVARAGELNRVPLQIGVEYAVTSAVPFSLTLPMGGFAEIRRNDPCEKTVKWPITFSVTTEDDGHTVVVTPYPSDPGGAYHWRRPGEDDEQDGPRARNASSRSDCSYTANGGRVSFDCGHGSCSCLGCWLAGDFVSDGVKCDLPTVWCGCTDSHGEEDDDPPPTTPHEDMASAPSVSATFSEPVVLFEDKYTNAPNDIVQRQSTTTRLTISAYGGPNGARLTLSKVGVDEKLEQKGGHRFPTKEVKIPADSDVNYEFVYEGKSASGGRDDVLVTASLVAVNAMSPEPSTAKLTSVKLAMEAVYTFPTNRARHVFGPMEESLFKFTPDALAGEVSLEGDVPEHGNRGGQRLTLGDSASTFSIVARCGMQSLTLPFSVLEPAGVEVIDVRPLSIDDWGILKEDPLLNGQAGVAANIDVRVLPNHVSFRRINLLEGYAPAESIWGCCTNTTYFPCGIVHDGIAGGSETYVEEGAYVNAENMLEPDRVAFWPPSSLEFPCDPGGYTFNIPWKWYADGRPRLHDWMVVPQVMTVHSNGDVSISKNGVTITRTKTGGMTWTR